MASSDDEGETLPDVVSDYYFCGAENEPLPFTELPVQWDESESLDDNKSQIFLRGTADNGLQKLYKQVKAWKYNFMKAKPEISVLSKGNYWIKLQKPRKSFEKEIRTILITVHSLHFFKRKPEASGKALWDRLSKVFSLYDIRPSENDLLDHLNFISEAVKRDETLAKSKFLASFLDKKPRKRKALNEDAEATRPSFIVDDMNGEYVDADLTTQETEDSESDDDDNVFDSVCAICDNGGDITCCDGKCLRSFHATVESAEKAESNCESLGLPAEEVEGSKHFICLNCRYKQHQCFACGELGSSDKSSVPEVFCCISATCGHFYHPQCVASLLHEGDAEAQDLQEKIAAGEPFTCPAHKCHKCKQAENKMVEDLQFAICRRCPRSYHRKCLPGKIVFYKEDKDEDVIARAWDGLLPKSRALLYCLKHKIDEELETPLRNLKFPEIGNSKKQPLEPLPSKKKVAVSDKDVNSDHTSEKRSFSKSRRRVEKSSSAVRPVDSSRKRMTMLSGPKSVKKQRVTDTSKKPLKRSLSMKVNRPKLDDAQPSLGSRLYELMMNGNEASNSKKDCTSVDEDEQSPRAKPPGIENSSLPSIDADSEQRILTLMEEATSSITLDEVKRSHIAKLPSTHAQLSKVDKTIILARVEGAVEAVHLALKKLEEGCRIEDAMTVCEPCVLDQLMKWKDKLKVYLAPFLHGMRYTSFGRHFTKVEKLEKIVDRLCWYVRDGDTIVDFCCGANDFSCILKKRLDEMGKKCSYKNYDFTRPKNDFNFEKRDWMSVDPKELPRGSQLIMGLNPPFGKNCFQANKFIKQALRFEPKLLVLTVPPETQRPTLRRLDHERRGTPYDLVWEDAELLTGKSFYLPGSIDVNDKQMDQWNITPPPLYIWSHPDWISKHKAIAQQQGHIPKEEQVLPSDENVTVVNHELNVEVVMSLDNIPVTKKDPDRTTEKAAASVNKSSGRDNNGTGTKEKQADENLKKKQSMEDRKEKHSPSLLLQSPASEAPHTDMQEVRAEKHPSPLPRQSRASETPHKDMQEVCAEKWPSPLPHQSRASETPHRDMQEGRAEKHPSSLPRQPRASEAPHKDMEEVRAEKHPSPLPCQSRAYEAPRLDMQEVHAEKHPSPLPHQSRAYETPCSDMEIVSVASRPFGQAMYDPYTHYDRSAAYSDYGNRRLDSVQFPGYGRENIESGGYNNRGAYIEENARHGIDSSLSQRRGFSTGYGPTADPSPYNRVSTSTIQRYAPRLDELNHTRMGPEPSMAGRVYERPLAGSGVRMDGFAPGLYRPFPHHNSSGGWLNE